MMSLQAILYSWLFMKNWDVGTWLSRSFALGSNQIKRFLSYNWARFLSILSYNWAEQSTPKRCELPWFSLKWTRKVAAISVSVPSPKKTGGVCGLIVGQCRGTQRGQRWCESKSASSIAVGFKISLCKDVAGSASWNSKDNDMRLGISLKKMWKNPWGKSIHKLHVELQFFLFGVLEVSYQYPEV